MKHSYYTLLLVLLLLQCRPKNVDSSIQFRAKPEVPLSITREHESLLENLHGITLYHDSTGPVAAKLKDLIQHHFKEEEDLVLPLLGLLPLLASGQLPEQSKDVIGLCEKLKSLLPHLSVEHQMIKVYMDELKQAAANEDLPAILEFEKELQKHAKTEEEVYFPAAMLIGEYLKLKSM